MKKLALSGVLSLLFVMSCTEKYDTPSDNREQNIKEIYETELAFNELAQDSGLAIAFAVFAAEDAVIKRGPNLIKGKKAISEYYRNHSNPNETLSWKPDHIEVSRSGDLASTSGGYVFTTIDSTGANKESYGFFHTVWKRQADGSWKFIWD